MDAGNKDEVRAASLDAAITQQIAENMQEPLNQAGRTLARYINLTVNADMIDTADKTIRSILSELLLTYERERNARK